MISFTMRIAEHSIAVCAQRETTRDYCRDYLTDEPPVLRVEVSPEDVLFEHTHGEQGLSDAYYEVLALYRKLTTALLPEGVLLFHGSAVSVNGKAYLFAAHSGVGKTTHSLLWLKNIPGCHIVNGDKPLLLFKEEGVFLCGTPWRGKERFGVNEVLPLAAVCLLERDSRNHIEEIPMSEALPAILSQVYHPKGRMTETVALVGKMSVLRFFRLGCNMEDEAALVSYRGMCCLGEENDAEEL